MLLFLTATTSILGRCRRPAASQQSLEEQLWPGWPSELTYMPFLEEQLGLMEEMGAKPSHLDERLSLASCDKGRCGSRVFEIDGLFRRIRMTYFDGGDKLQVFNSLWYPSFDRDAPLLGVDLLAFAGSKKILCVVDAQPPASRDYDASRLDEIRAGAPELAGTVSERWYEDSRYFSPQMLYSRFEESGKDGVDAVLFPTFQKYIRAYVDLVEGVEPASGEDDRRNVRRAQAEFDAWNAERDPAHNLFKSYFGEDFADDYVNHYLFALAGEADSRRLRE